jgi:hypothetical protein
MNVPKFWDLLLDAFAAVNAVSPVNGHAAKRQRSS